MEPWIRKVVGSGAIRRLRRRGLELRRPNVGDLLVFRLASRSREDQIYFYRYDKYCDYLGTNDPNEFTKRKEGALSLYRLQSILPGSKLLLDYVPR